MNVLLEDIRETRSPEAYIKRLGFEPDEWQLNLLESKAQKIIMACGRQVGKSTVTGLKAYRKAKTVAGSLVLLISHSFRQSLILFEKVEDAVRRDGMEQVDKLNLQELRLKNGSRIVAAPGKGETVRGFSGVNLLVIDEAAYVTDTLYAAVSPMVAASDGQVILLSSPAGKEGFFWKIWEGAEDWERYRIMAKECPRIPDEFLRTERLMIPDHIYRREYEAEFTEGVNSLVSYDDLQAARLNTVKSLISDSIVTDNTELPKVEALIG